MHSGSCLCGAVKYATDAPIESASHCHCSQCRKAHGAAFGSYGNVPWSSFRWVAGEESVARYHSSPGVTRTFCRQCGATRFCETVGLLHCDYGRATYRRTGADKGALVEIHGDGELVAAAKGKA